MSMIICGAEQSVHVTGWSVSLLNEYNKNSFSHDCMHGLQ